MKNTKSCPKCGSTDIVRIPDNPNRHASGNNIYTSTYTLFGKIPVIRYVCCSCGYAENWVENEEELESERDVVELPFAASDQFSDVAKIPIYSYDEEGNLEYNSVEPRLLAYNGVKGVFTGLDWNTLLSMYYQTYQSIIRRPIVITEKIEINDIELRDLDMTVPIYLAQYGRYYAIISIKAEDTGICECKLLQLEV